MFVMYCVYGKNRSPYLESKDSMIPGESSLATCHNSTKLKMHGLLLI